VCGGGVEVCVCKRIYVFETCKQRLAVEEQARKQCVWWWWESTKCVGGGGAAMLRGDATGGRTGDVFPGAISANSGNKAVGLLQHAMCVWLAEEGGGGISSSIKEAQACGWQLAVFLGAYTGATHGMWNWIAAGVGSQRPSAHHISLVHLPWHLAILPLISALLQTA